MTYYSVLHERNEIALVVIIIVNAIASAIDV